MRDLSIIMPTRNRPAIAAQNLAKTRAHFPDVPIYVFDDASDDPASVAAAAASILGCTLIRSERQVGPAGARRRLIGAAEARWCLAIDDDCHPSEDFDPSRWVAMEPGPKDPIIVCFRYYNVPFNEFAPADVELVGPCLGLLGGASLLHRESVIAVGNYNEFYVFGAEDTDLSRRVWASGRQIWIDPTNTIIHDHVAEGRDLQRESYYYVRNRILLNVLSLPLWYGLPLGLGQASKRWLVQPYKLSGLLGILGGLTACGRYFNMRKPLTVKEYRKLLRLPV